MLHDEVEIEISELPCEHRKHRCRLWTLEYMGNLYVISKVDEVPTYRL